MVLLISRAIVDAHAGLFLAGEAKPQRAAAAIGQCEVPGTLTVSGVDFVTTPDADPAFINVRAEIPVGSPSPAGRLFGRLNAAGN